MDIELKEFLGAEPITQNINLTEGYNALDNTSKKFIMQDIEGIHAGPTRNFTWYTAEALKYSVKSWTEPYNKPLIMHHNEKNGKIIGRVLAVEYKEHNTRSGTPALVFTCKVPDKEGIEQILDGRLKTTSIGVTALEAHCSICGKPLDIDPQTGESRCRHIRGHVYNGDVCYWMVTKMEAKELSYVIVPSDKFAHNLRTYYADGKTIDTQESLTSTNQINLKEGEINQMPIPNNSINKDDVKDLKENTVIDEVTGAAQPDPTEPKVTEPENKPEQNEEPKENPKADPVVEEETIESLKAKIAQLEQEKEESVQAAKEAKKLLVAAQTEIDKLTTEVKDEKATREAAESELIETKAEFRESLENNVNAFREMLNKEPLTKETLATRATVSLQDSILDLREELMSSSKHINLQEAADPTIKKQFDNFEKNKEEDCVKENKSNSNINMTESSKDENPFDFLRNFAK